MKKTPKNKQELHDPAMRLFDGRRVCRMPALPFSAAAYLTEKLRAVYRCSVVAVVESSRAADEFSANLAALQASPGENCLQLPPADDAAAGMSGARLQALYQLSLPAGPRVVVTCVQALMQTAPERATLLSQAERIVAGHQHDPLALAERLAAAGYDFVGEVQMPGQAARRGGLLDVWPAGTEWPCRVEFLGDTVETMRWFDPATQRSREAAGLLMINPLNDAGRENDRRRVSPVAHLPSDAIYCWIEAAGEAASGMTGLAAHAEVCLKSDPAAVDTGRLATLEEVRAAVAALAGGRELFCGDYCDRSDWPLVDPGFRALTAPAAGRDDLAAPDIFEARRRAWLDELAGRARAGRRVCLFFGTAGARQRFQELYPGMPFDLSLGNLSDGFENDGLNLTVVAESNLSGRRKWARGGVPARPARRRTAGAGEPVTDVLAIEPGDLVVHVEHGIGRYQGLYEVEFDGRRQEVLAVEYAGKARLYVPVMHSHLLSRYIGAGSRAVRLHRLGGRRWTREKHAAAAAVRDLAAALLETQAQRSAREGYAFPADGVWQHEFDAAFPYQETDDQERAVAEVRGDMQAARPMDRLVCGDAGYGKTEVAMRAAFRCVMAGRQVAVLVPTTVLAQQHFECFSERMSAYPVRVAMLCRFQSTAAAAAIRRELRSGAIDIVIGTHRMLQAQVAFKDLGLVVIDEEQKFGVAHKERLKQMKNMVDVLTLTATPIPRTLYLSLAGVREISVIQTPPRDRRPIETLVTRGDDTVIREAILRELNRGGQVFYVYNRVMTITAMAQKLRRLTPEARIAVGHGQMSAGELEQVMRAFARGDYDVLLCTTIIESGLDIPNANTIIIDRADRFGVAELYQLRGRVGRADRKAYAYLLLPARGYLPEDARRRLGAIMEHSGAGAGFRLALRDLEIRGAGNLLGSAQSGHIAAVGFELYCRLLRRAVAGLQGAPCLPAARPAGVEVRLDFIEFSPLAAGAHNAVFLTADYIEDERLRLEFFRRMALADTPDDLAEVGREITDRFGPPPPPVRRLLRLAELRLLAGRAGLMEVEVCDGCVRLRGPRGYFQVQHRFPRLRTTDTDARLDEIRSLLIKMPAITGHDAKGDQQDA